MSRRVARVAAAVAVGLLLVGSAAEAAVTQPPQPRHGPGGSDYSNAGVRVSSGGEGPDAWYAFEPTNPRPKRAPLSVITHGYYEFAGYGSKQALIEHTVRTGSVVVYPRWQTNIATPCPGPVDIEPCMASEVAGIKGALAYLRTPGHVRPQVAKTSYFGFSFGGIITANLANRWRELGVPKPRVVFLDDPHDGGLTGADEPALDDDLGGIPSSALVQCHSGSQGVIAGTTQQGESLANGSCNAVFPKLTSVPARNKDLVMTRPDAHGEPALTSAHGVCAARTDPSTGLLNPPNAYDWGFCWKVWDAMRACALEGRWCNYALGDTRRHRTIGTWSDGTPITPLTVQDAVPLRP